MWLLRSYSQRKGSSFTARHIADSDLSMVVGTHGGWLVGWSVGWLVGLLVVVVVVVGGTW